MGRCTTPYRMYVLTEAGLTKKGGVNLVADSPAVAQPATSVTSAGLLKYIGGILAAGASWPCAPKVKRTTTAKKDWKEERHD